VPYFERWPDLAGRHQTLVRAERLGPPYPTFAAPAGPVPAALAVDPDRESDKSLNRVGDLSI
jgi:hypothetical protein